jgi:spore photoproduct lyase
MSQTGALPAHLAGITRIYADHDAAGGVMAERVRSALPGAEFLVLERGASPPASQEGAAAVYLKRYKGAFHRFCPGALRYNCCGYRIAHIGENCPFDCTYCVLKAYFQDKLIKVWANRDELFDSLARDFSDRRFRCRVGTGEFTDSLALEPLTRYSRDLAEFLAGFENVRLEIKSKFADLSWMEAARPDRLLPAWSVNAPEIVEREEAGASPLEDRLRAARAAAEAGFRVCLHFDPIIRYPGWEKGYARACEMIADYLRPESLAYLSMGSFRFMPALKERIEERRPDARYIYEEYSPGLDGKMRLLRPLRVEQFRFLAGRLKAWGAADKLYLCMESDEVWRASLGTTPSRMGGLGERLLDLAFG